MLTVTLMYMRFCFGNVLWVLVLQVVLQFACCGCSAVLAQTSDIAELLTDYQIDLLRALEMSRLQFLREIGSLQPGTSDRLGGSSS